MASLVKLLQADRIFRQVRQLEPYRSHDMDIFSSALWHLRQEVPLSYLAHELLQLNRRSPQAWCAVGNLFSLKHDHESALKCFKRAIQVDPYFTYAYTLSGHEYISIEDLDKAQSHFRTAIRIDNRHYNAWYGLGIVYFRQEKLDLAEFHFKKAVSINSSSPILTIYMGVVFERKEKYLDALQSYEKAEKLRPEILLYTFRRASALLALDRCDEALLALDDIKDLEPPECNISFLLGKIYKRQGKIAEALRYFTRAQDIYGAKVVAAIKEEIGMPSSLSNISNIMNRFLSTITDIVKRLF
ncbi:anaphase-promoting complex subunit cdc27 [Dinochytrium kinnereticum]|nr:anaphase-promoting complex subunit cdc27 [Dinochytrium kinnereticum]